MRKAAAFIVHKKEGSVLPNRATQRSTKAIVSQCWFSLIQQVAIPRVCVQSVILKIVVCGTVKAVGTAFRNHGHLASRREAEIGGWVRDSHAKLFHTLCRHWNHRLNRLDLAQRS